MAKKISKEELKSKDTFLRTGDQFLQILEKNWMAILGVGIVAILVGGSYVGYQKWNLHLENQAQEDIFTWINKIEAKQQTWSEQKQAATQSLEAKKSDPADVKMDYEADFGPLVSGLETEIKQHKDTVAAQTAAMKLADFLAEHQKVDQAAELLQSVGSSLEKSSWIYGLFKVQLASLLSQVGKTEEALTQLSDVSEAKSAKYLHPEAMLKMAVLQEELGNPAKAKELYSRVSTDYADTEAGKSAQALSRLLEIREQIKAPAPKETSQPLKEGA